jgi:hypothetical protein
MVYEIYYYNMLERGICDVQLSPAGLPIDMSTNSRMIYISRPNPSPTQASQGNRKQRSELCSMVVRRNNILLCLVKLSLEFAGSLFLC